MRGTVILSKHDRVPCVEEADAEVVVAETLGVKEGRYALRINSGPGARQESLYLHVTGVQRLGKP